MTPAEFFAPATDRHRALWLPMKLIHQMRWRWLQQRWCPKCRINTKWSITNQEGLRMEMCHKCETIVTGIIGTDVGSVYEPNKGDQDTEQA